MPDRGLLAGRWRSLRLRTYFVVVAVLLLPLAVVATANFQEAGTASRMLTNTTRAATETAESLQQMKVDPDAFRNEVEIVARRHSVWIRVYDLDGVPVVDAYQAERYNPLRGTDRIFYGKPVATLREFDSALPPVLDRWEVKEAKARNTASDCRTAEVGQLLVCHGVLYIEEPSGESGWVIYTQEKSRRAIRALYDFREEIFKLTLFVLPFALFLAWWLGSRIMSPIRKLRRQVVDMTTQAAPGADLDLGRADEFGELAAAFNALLGELRERSQQNEGFVADLAHEFKNPVAAIRAAAESLAHGDVNERKAVRLAGILNDSSRRLDDLVTQFLELARAEAGMTADERSEVDLTGLALGIADVLGQDERYAAVELAVSAEGNTNVQGVPHALESVLRNLMENAVSFAAPDGTVEVKVDGRGAMVHAEVMDTGPGIAAEDLPRVFDRFFTTRGSRQGTGLGLALVRATIEAHGGTITAHSEPGAGATFRFRLPRAASLERAATVTAGRGA